MATKVPESDSLTFEEALLHVPGWTRAGGQTPVPLHTGAHNRAFRVRTEEGTFALRVQPSNGQTLGADRKREAALHAVAAAHGLAPAMVYADPGGLCIVTEYVSGEVWTPARMSEPASLARLGGLLQTLHRIPPPQVAPFDVLGLIRKHCERLGAANPADRAALELLVRDSASQLESIGGSTRKPSIVHNDLHHSNIIDAGGLVLIDWEYAAVADPLFDLACVLAYYPETQKMAALLLEQAGLAGSATVAMLRTAAALFRTLSELWARVGRLSTES